MAKKKFNYTEVLGYEPSKYQNDIFDFVVHGVGNAVIRARAGSGKTATIVASMKLVPKNKKCLFLAFNKSVADELVNKMLGYENCTVRTIHGLGYSILSNNHFECNVDEYKYKTYLKRNLNDVADITSYVKIHGKKHINDYITSIIELLDFSRVNLAQSEKEIKNIANSYGISILHNEIKAVKKLLDWGKENTNTIDYTDMVWLPNELNLFPVGNTYDWIFNDEAQDYSIAYVKLFQKCFKRGTRFISCGDEFQSINQFAGASKQAFETMCNFPNTVQFNLPISYRCAIDIIKEANTIVSDIVANDGATKGLVLHNSRIVDIKDNDMVLSRTNAPLFRMYTKLIKNGIPCYIKGKESTRQLLVDTINSYDVNEKLGNDFVTDGLFPRLYEHMMTIRNELVENGMFIEDANTHQSVLSMYDRIATLNAISDNCHTTTDLKEKIDRIFNNDNVGVCLSTIHKAKGLEADNVHILCRSEIPAKSAKTQSEIQQELNLLYVAITRAKNKLCYVSEKEFYPTHIMNNTDDDISAEFQYIERKLSELIGFKAIQPMENLQMAERKIQFATKIDPIHKHDNKKVIQPLKSAKKTNLLDGLLKQ